MTEGIHNLLGQIYCQNQQLLAAAALLPPPPVGTIVGPIISVPIAITGSGDHDVITPAVGNVIRVLGYSLGTDATDTAIIQDAAMSLSGTLYFVAGLNQVLPYNPMGWFQSTVTGSPVFITLATGANMGGVILYVEVTP